jgi:membrane-bound serine protease (ClpP class)
VTVGGQPRRQLRPDVDIAFSQLTIFPRVLHSAASPNVAFVMLVVALALAVFEFFTAGVGVAAATAALFGVLAAYGLGVLPTRPWAVALVGAGMVGFAIDVQSGAPRAWTVIGALAMAAGGLRLYQGAAVSAWVLAVMGVLLLVFMISGMPAVVRTRFSTPTIGRASMVGVLGVALSGVDPDGTVEINGAPWRARTNRATPIPSGGAVRVVAIDGLVLEVEPEGGGARDSHH